ncbi:potassium channel family protein [Micrococcoides hystricis]|uniref:Trk system potassium uptake protein TrkA n=1 Tax=Micrococcoides hystricis TaxID=1572761 RepID=A0ABV6P6X8_9MICC
MAHFVILGCGRVGAALATTLEGSGHSVAVIDQNEQAFHKLGRSFQGTRIEGVGFDKDVLIKARIREAYAFAAVSNGDNTNIIAARVAREMFKVPHVVARIYDPGRAEIYQRLGISTVAAVRWTTDQVLRRILPEQGIAGDYRDASGRLILAEIDVHPSWVGEKIIDLEAEAGIRAAYLTRFGEGVLVRADTRLQQGDILHAMVPIATMADVDRLLSSDRGSQPKDEHTASSANKLSRYDGANQPFQWEQE